MKIRNTSILKKDIIFHEQDITFYTTWGLFSPREIDDGTKLLLGFLVMNGNEKVCDLGCGYGALSLPLAKKYPDSKYLLLDKDFVAVDFAEKNAKENKLKNVSALLSNGFSAVSEKEKFDLVLSNIPAKVGRELLYIFVSDGFEHLEDHGRMVLVCIIGLRDFVKDTMSDVFGNVKKLKESRTYIVYESIKN